MLKSLFLAAALLVLGGCAVTPPQRTDNLCAIFVEKRDWYKAAKKAEARWGVPLQIPMAIMYQESRFRHNARPARTKLLGIVPWTRPSSAYGYSQAKTDTWRDYRREAGGRGADRNDFGDAVDFVSWYISKTHAVNKVSKWDARAQYLNYHEGWGGYRSGSHHRKDWLLQVATGVERRASDYGAQYRGCKKELDKSWWQRLFS